ncbi:hypothetical protein [Streptomyces zaomyceticus]|uniref:hypothetical protein n=1 Tax=Streptomyces zaomyceticus TaxID=68286 RepID=UPI00367ACA68
MSVALGKDALEGFKGIGYVKGARILLTTGVWPRDRSFPDRLTALNYLVRTVILHTSRADAEVTPEHVGKLLALAFNVAQKAKAAQDRPALQGIRGDGWALSDRHALAAYHLINNHDIYRKSAEALDDEGNSIIFRQWKFPHPYPLVTKNIFHRGENGLWEVCTAGWPSDKVYFFGVSPNDQGELAIGNLDTPVEVLFYLAEHDPERRPGFHMVLAIPGAGEPDHSRALASLCDRTGVRGYAPRIGGAHLFTMKIKGIPTIFMKNMNSTTAGTWKIGGANIASDVPHKLPKPIGAAGGGGDADVPARVFTDISGTVHFTVAEVIRRRLITLDGKRVMGVSTTPDPDTILLRGDVLHGLNVVSQLAMVDEANGSSVTVPIQRSPGVVLVYAGQGGNVHIRLTGDRHVELLREEAALMFNDLPELHEARERLAEESFLRGASLWILNGYLPDVGEHSNMEESPSMADLMSVVTGMLVEYVRGDGMIEILEPLNIRARPGSEEGSSQFMETIHPKKLSEVLGADWSSSDELAEFATMSQLVARMQKRPGDVAGQRNRFGDSNYVKDVLADYVKARPELQGLTHFQLRPHFVEEVLSEASENIDLTLDMFLKFPLLRQIGEERGRDSIGGVPGTTAQDLKNWGQLVNELAGKTSKSIRSDFSTTLKAVYSVIPPHHQPLEDAKERLRTYLDRALSHATAPDSKGREGAENYSHILQLITQARKAGRAVSDAALTAYLLQHSGLFDRTPLLTVPRDKTVLRDFSHRSTGVPSKTIFRAHGTNLRIERNSSNMVRGFDAPWSAGPYMVTAPIVGAKTIVIEGTPYSPGVLAQLAAHDPARRDGADIVAVVPRLGRDDRRFQRELAALVHSPGGTGRQATAWAHDGEVVIRSNASSPVPVLITVIHQPGEHARWIPAVAADRFSEEWAELEVRTLDNESVKVTDLVFATAMHSSGKEILGYRATSKPVTADLDGMDATPVALPTLNHRIAAVLDRQGGPLSYSYERKHGGVVRLSAKEEGRILRSRSSLSRLLDDPSGVILSTASASLTYEGEDPLLGLSAAEQTAEETQRAIAVLTDGPEKHSALVLVWPLPDYEALEKLVKSSGLDTLPTAAGDPPQGSVGPHEQNTTLPQRRLLRWIRQLRLSIADHRLGLGSDDVWSDPLQTYLPGIRAIEQMRLEDLQYAPNADHPLTTPVLEGILRQFIQSRPQMAPRSTADQLTALLAEAAQTPPGTPLSAFLTSTPTARPAAQSGTLVTPPTESAPSPNRSDLHALVTAIRATATSPQERGLITLLREAANSEIAIDLLYIEAATNSDLKEPAMDPHTEINTTELIALKPHLSSVQKVQAELRPTGIAAYELRLSPAQWAVLHGHRPLTPRWKDTTAHAALIAQEALRALRTPQNRPDTQNEPPAPETLAPPDTTDAPGSPVTAALAAVLAEASLQLTGLARRSWRYKKALNQIIDNHWNHDFGARTDFVQQAKEALRVHLPAPSGDLLAVYASGLSEEDEKAFRAEVANIRLQKRLWANVTPAHPGCNEKGTWGTSAGGAGRAYSMSVVNGPVYAQLKSWWLSNSSHYIRSSVTSGISFVTERNKPEFSPTFNYHLLTRTDVENRIVNRWHNPSIEGRQQ